MAREFGLTRVDLWNREDHRALSVPAQHLLHVLNTSPTLSYVGVADWRPNRIASLSTGWPVESIECAALELERALFVLVDRETEEVLIREWIRDDGLMKQPKMSVSMASAFAGTASSVLRRVIVHELKRLHEDFPDLNGWKPEAVQKVMSEPSTDPATYPFGEPVYPKQSTVLGKQNFATTTTAPTTAPGSQLRPGLPDLVSGGLVTRVKQDPRASYGPTGDHGRIVVIYREACEALGFSPSSDQTSKVGNLARELLDNPNNSFEDLAEAARLAATEGIPYIDRTLGRVFAARQKSAKPVVSENDDTYRHTLGGRPRRRHLGAVS